MSSSSKSIACKQFRCIIFGEEGTLAARCAELLREAGHEIVAMVTPSPQIASWANDNDVRVLAPGPHLASELNRVYFDHLFSIANWQIIPADVLAMASGLAINYHDSLLPAYGGANATAWAIALARVRLVCLLSQNYLWSARPTLVLYLTGYFRKK